MLGKFAHEVEEQLTMEDIAMYVAFSRIEAKELEKRNKRGR